jgi:hypothetical protein
MMHQVPRTRLTAPAVAGQLERGVRPHPSRSERVIRPGSAAQTALGGSACRLEMGCLQLCSVRYGLSGDSWSWLWTSSRNGSGWQGRFASLPALNARRRCERRAPLPGPRALGTGAAERGEQHAPGPEALSQRFEDLGRHRSDEGAPWNSQVRPNVRAKLPAEACSVRLVCDGAEGAAHQAYAACRSGSA